MKNKVYTFHDSWQLKELNLVPNERYRVLYDVGDLKKGEIVSFIGFDDVDNHYGIFVFNNDSGKILEVTGDFSGPNHSRMVALGGALSKA